MHIRLKREIDLKVWCRDNLSKFFYQEPCGAASGLHESLPSFLQRLAERHAVPNGPFFLQTVHPEPVPSSGSLLGGHSRSLLAGKGYAEQVAHVVARECCEEKVLRLIQGPLSQHVALFRDLRDVTAWCPSCLSEWAKEKKTIYRPLLWSLRSVKVCPRHKIVLQERCPHCAKTFHHFASTSWSTTCSACGKSLLDGPRTYKRVGFDAFAAKAICELLNWGWQCSDADFQPGQFKLNIQQAIDAVGGEYCLSSIIGLSRAVIHTWRREERRPSLQGLVHLSYSFNIPIRSWLKDALTNENISSPKPRTIPATALNQRHPSLTAVRHRIKAILGDSNSVPVSLTEMARQLHTTSYRLYRDCPKLAARIVERYAEYRKLQKVNKQRNKEEAVRAAIRDMVATGNLISRNGVLFRLNERGIKSTWVIKEIFANEMQKVRDGTFGPLPGRTYESLTSIY